MKLLEYFLQWRKADKKEQVSEEYYAESEYMRGFQSGFETGLKMSTQVDRMALDMARTDGIDEILKRFNEPGNSIIAFANPAFALDRI